MISFGGRQISGIFYGGRVITAVYNGVVLIWQAIRSCFGTGTWREDKPWIDDDTWKNN